MITKLNPITINKVGRFLLVFILFSLLIVPIAGCAGTKSPLTMNLSQPVDGANITASSTLEVLGTVSDAKAIVTVNDVKAAMAPGGYFGYNITLIEGVNTIKIVATRGKESVTKTLTVTYSPAKR